MVVAIGKNTQYLYVHMLQKRGVLFVWTRLTGKAIITNPVFTLLGLESLLHVLQGIFPSETQIYSSQVVTYNFSNKIAK